MNRRAGHVVPKQLFIRQEPLNPLVRHFLVPASNTTRLVRGKEVPIKPDIRLQSAVTPILMSSNVLDAHAKRGKLTVFVRHPAHWDAVEPKVINEVYRVLGIKDEERNKLTITRL
jgi:hypothetical protein